MSHGKWYHKGEVLSDLVQLSGRHTTEGRIREVIDRPPAVASGNDEEMEELLRRCGRRNNCSVGNTNEEPDLAYITDLIAQARQYDNNLPDYNNVQSSRDLTEPNSLVISKTGRFDPTVPEFRPRTAPNAPKINQDENEEIKKENTEIIVSVKVKANDALKSEIAKAAEDLKKTIIMPNTNTVESKIRRNAALMSLMKLYSVAAPVPLVETSVSPGEVNIPLKDTPMQSACEVNIPLKDTPIQTAREVNIPLKYSTVQTAREVNIPLKYTTVQTAREVRPPSIKTPIQHQVIKTNDAAGEKIDEVSPRQLAESIEKVDNWLNGKKESTIVTKPKCAVQLTPFTYKKRDKLSPRDCDTPKSVQSVASVQSTSSPVKKYIPSKYAEELCAEFEKQREGRLLEEAGDKTLWGYIEKGIHDNKYSKGNAQSVDYNDKSQTTS